MSPSVRFSKRAQKRTRIPLSVSKDSAPSATPLATCLWSQLAGSLSRAPRLLSRPAPTRSRSSARSSQPAQTPFLSTTVQLRGICPDDKQNLLEFVLVMRENRRGFRVNQGSVNHPPLSGTFQVTFMCGAPDLNEFLRFTAHNRANVGGV